MCMLLVSVSRVCLMKFHMFNLIGLYSSLTSAVRDQRRSAKAKARTREGTRYEDYDFEISIKFMPIFTNYRGTTAVMPERRFCRV